jgi:transcriptional regulator with XRE-family HTH domain
MATPEKENLGRRIRAIRKELGLTMAQLAEQVGVNYATIHRVETGKVSPSVVLLSEIAHCLGQTVVSLLQDDTSRLHVIRATEQPLVESEKLAIRLLVPKGVINDRISLSLGQGQEGEIVSRHKTEGFELAYILGGKCIFTHGGQEVVLEKGDLVYFDGKMWHSVYALEPLEFLAIYFRDKP